MKTNNLFLILFSIILISCQKEDVEVEKKPEVEAESYEGTFRGMMKTTERTTVIDDGTYTAYVDSTIQEVHIEMKPYGIDSVIFYSGYLFRRLL
ncbi:hypothetical protein [Crocinitomix catalasitica]|uniref:hypothetical protein n=1 Tax=Crocinitomix catalasitica TaxID=184607 RepID=UPI0012F92273|nr:hypothetical protein [Crocinitomix catalasitica]